MRGILYLIVALTVSLPALAQQQTTDTNAGTVADSSVGQVGQRQTTTQTAPSVDPTQRLDNRIANRVQTRISNRIDPFYNSQTSTLSAFTTASESVSKQ